MTLLRMQELESLRFEWDYSDTTWDDRFCELADYQKIHGHCNVPHRDSENAKLATWVGTQRTNYRSQLEGNTSPMTLSRIQELESLGFEWEPAICRGNGQPKKPTRVHEGTVQSLEHMQTTAHAQEAFNGREILRDQVDASYEAEESDRNDEVHLVYIPGCTEEI
jgi:hypothetical protein